MRGDLIGQTLSAGIAGTLTTVSFVNSGAQGEVYQTSSPKYYLKVWRPEDEDDLHLDPSRYEAAKQDATRRYRTFSRLHFGSERELTCLPLEFVQVADRPAYIMERAVGEELGEGWHNLMQLGLKERMQIARSLANGISVVHSRNAVHADIRRDNFYFVSATCSIQILDIDGGGYWGRETGTEQFPPSVRGIPRYVAPELHQFQRTGVWDAIWHIEGRRKQPDLWSLAVLIYDIVVDRDGPFPRRLFGQTGAFTDHPDWPVAEQRAKFRELGIDKELLDLFTEVFRSTNRTRVDYQRPSAAHWSAFLRRAIERSHLTLVTHCPICNSMVTDLTLLICPNCAERKRTTALWGYTTCPKGHSTPARSPHSKTGAFCMHRGCGMSVS